MPARFCSQCAYEVSSTARFCPNCAAALEEARGARVPRPPADTSSEAAPPSLAVTPILTPIDAAATKTRKLLLPLILAALVVLTIAVAVLAGKARQQASLVGSTPSAPNVAPSLLNAPTGPPTSGTPLTNAPAMPPTSGAPLTNAPTQPPVPGPGLTNAPNTPTPSLPPDVAAYLNFLQGIEQRRVAMNNDVSGASAMLGMAQGLSAGGGLAGADADPEGAEDTTKAKTQKISQGYSDYALKWQTLIRDFRATPAPPACTTLAARYLTFLGDYTTVISKMQVALLNHDSNGLPDLSAVTQVQGQVNTDGGLADTELTNLCGRYGVNKPFTIAPEGASPSLLGH
jgi:hypothetical protein